jgi:hypothetical protein
VQAVPAPGEGAETLRITVYGQQKSWTFEPGAVNDQRFASAHKATLAPVAFGDTREGLNLGYVVRLLIPNDALLHAFPVESQVFVTPPATATSVVVGGPDP